MSQTRSRAAFLLFLLGTAVYFLFSLKEVGNFYQTGHAGFVNAEVGLSHMNTLNNGFLRTKLGATNYQVIYDRAPTAEEYYVRYPHLHNLLLALLWTVTGPSEIAARVVMILLVFLSFLVLRRITRELGFPPLFSDLTFFSLCSFPVFYHYAGLSNGEISALLPLALSALFYLRHLESRGRKGLLPLLISLTVACQLFWIGYIAAFVFFLDSLFRFFLRKETQAGFLALGLTLTVGFNLAVFILHTLWLVGSLDRVVDAFLWRAGIEMPETHKYTLSQFFLKNAGRWWLFNPLTILLSLGWIVRFFRKAKEGERRERRIFLLILGTAVLFCALLSHLVYWHDFLIIYFAYFLAPAAAGPLFTLYRRLKQPRLRTSLIAVYTAILLLFAGLGLARAPEEKMIDRDTDNYELYYTLKVIRNQSTKEDAFLLNLDRAQQPQVRFYLRRVSHFNPVPAWAKGYVESGRFSYYLVENKGRFRPIVKYLLDHYRGYKYGRYFLFDLKNPGSGLRVFQRRRKSTGWMYQYFVSPYHQPGGFEEVTDPITIKRLRESLADVRDLYPHDKEISSGPY